MGQCFRVSLRHTKYMPDMRTLRMGGPDTVFAVRDTHNTIHKGHNNGYACVRSMEVRRIVVIRVNRKAYTVECL